MSQFIATTPLLNMRPVGSPAERSLPRLQAILEREFKGKIGLKLAEPVARADGAGIDWYTDTDDELIQLTSIHEELADYYKKRLQADVSVISATAGRYEGRNDQASRTTAAALRNAICHPGDDYIWLGGDVASGKASIILTAWGYEPRSSELTGSHVINRRERIFPATQQVVIDQHQPAEGEAPTSSVAAATVSPAPRNWLGILSSVLWAVALILPFVIGWMLLPACGVRVPFTGNYVFGFGGGDYCRQIVNPEIDERQTEGAALTTELAAATEQVRGKALQCTPVDPVDEVRKRVLNAGVELKPDETTVSLIWNTLDDLDLAIVCPNGQRIYHGNKKACGGILEVDQNDGMNPSTATPIEHINFGDGVLMSGDYSVEVKYFKTANGAPATDTPFKVIIQQQGKAPVIKEASVQSISQTLSIANFTTP